MKPCGGARRHYERSPALRPSDLVRAHARLLDDAGPDLLVPGGVQSHAAAADWIACLVAQAVREPTRGAEPAAAAASS